MPKLKNSPELDLKSKYQLYEKAVQCPAYDVDFFIDQYKKFFKKAPRVLREDFCGTGAISCEWVKRGSKMQAYGIDLDPLPIEYGKENHYSALSLSEKKRMHYLQKNVLSVSHIKADIVAALNFSYFIFKKRQDLLGYFKSVRRSLGPKSVFFLDLFGGTECQQAIEDVVDHGEFFYYWDCEKFNPITNECLYKIHFKLKGKRHKYKDVFTYDWRLWSLPELQDLLTEAGFSQVHAFWEGDGDDGSGDGKYYTTREEENCESWVSYLAAIP